MTPLHLAVEEGERDVIKVLVEAGASVSAVNDKVIKHSVKLIQSNIKLLSDTWGMSSKMKEIEILNI